MNRCLFLDESGNPLCKTLPLDSHTLGKIYDGKVSVYKYEDDKFWMLLAKVEGKRFVQNWVIVNNSDDEV